MLDAASAFYAPGPAPTTLLDPDADLWGPLLASPGFMDDPLSSDASSEATLSPPLSSMSSSSSGAEDDELMDLAPSKHRTYALYSRGDSATDSSEDSMTRAADAGVQHQPTPSQGANGPAWASSESKSLLSTLWAPGDAGNATAAPSVGAQVGPLLWANPTPTLMRVDATQLPNATTMELRRLKNRECMRRARQRQREDYTRMKATAARLEKQYAELCARAAPVDVSMGAGGAVMTSEEQRYAAAVALSTRLGAENLHLKAGLQQQGVWKEQLLRILNSTADSFGLPVPASSSPHRPIPPSTLPTSTAATVDVEEPAVAQALKELDRHEAAEVFSFSRLDESAVGRAMIDNAHVTQEVRASLLAAVRAKDPRVKRHDVLGWDVIQRVRGSLMEYSFSKTFTDVDIDAAGDRMWMNDMRMDTFRVILYSLRRLDVLQQVSPNAFILGRDVTYPECSTVYRSLFMRFRTQVSREIPNGSQPPLKATGFIIGTHSLNRDWACASSSPRHASYRPGEAGRPGGLEEGEALEWLDMALVTEFLTIEDPTTGEKRHTIQWMGRTDPKSHAEALRNAPDTLTVCLRTEMLTIGPAVRLLRGD